MEQRARRIATRAAGAALLAASNPVPAHVKWFAECEYGTHAPATDVLGRPLLWVLLIAAATAVALLRELEHTSIGQALALRVFQVQQRLAELRSRVLICSTIFFLAALATTGNLILAPELTTQLTAVRWLQALAAIALFARQGEPVAGMALLALFGLGIAEYGAFHVIDYLIVLGLALYFLVPRWPSATRIRFLRVAAALSLMWVSVEKWVFPGWVMQIVHDHPVITFGFPQKEFVVIAGVVEFALGFGLLWRGLYSVVSALILAAFMSAAILEFGFIDLVGHIAILGVLLAIALDRIAPPRLRAQPPTWSPAAALLGSSAAVLLVYYGIVYTLHGSGTVEQMAAQAQPIAPTVPAHCAITIGVERHDPGGVTVACQAYVHGGARRGAFAEVDRVLAEHDVRDPGDSAEQRIERVAIAVVHDHDRPPEPPRRRTTSMSASSGR